MKVVMLSGKQGSGKSTLQRTLASDWTEAGGLSFELNFSDVIYEMHNYVLQVLDRHLPPRGITKDGALLQLLGTEWGRRTLGDDIWIRCLEERVQQVHGSIAFDPKEALVIIGDCRFPNEFDAFPEALRLRLIAREEIRRIRATSWRENSTHQSEVALDNYEADWKFDLIFDTEVLAVSECSSLIMRALKSGSFDKLREMRR